VLDIDINNFPNLFANSIASGKLINFAITDFGEKIKKSRISFGNVPLGIYRQGTKKKRTPIFHDKEKEKEIHQLVANLAQRGNFSASFRNFQQKITMNFTAEDFAKGLYFTTFTFNNFQTKMPFSFSPWTKKATKCFLKDRKGKVCDGKHLYRTVSLSTSSFLAEKKAAKKRLGRELEGANDLFVAAIRTIVET
jgi:hypothetical protein